MWTRSKMTLAAGVAALAMAASPAAFAQGKGNGNGNGNGKGGPPAASAKGNQGKGNSDRGGGQKADRGPSKSNGNGNAMRGKDRDVDRGGPAVKANRGNGNGNGNGNAKRVETDYRGNGNGNGNAVRGNGNGNRDAFDRRSNVNVDVDYALPQLRRTFGTSPRVIDGCPPGLAKKNNGCLPPGQAKARYRDYDPRFFGLTGAERGDYYYRDGYLLRYGGSGLSGYIPLLAGALGIGDVWPNYYQSEPMPRYYGDYYGLGDQRSYRYADNVIYRVDPETSAIASVAALLTGDDFRIGQPMPRGYDVYNVPYSYRDRYYDTPDANYRYADGYVYRVDPTTRLIQAAIELLV